MADRKSVIPITIRLRSPIHRKLASAAKAKDISLNEEIVQRIESTIGADDWAEQRERWLLAIDAVVTALPAAATAIKAARDELEIAAEKHIQDETFPKKGK